MNIANILTLSRVILGIIIPFLLIIDDLMIRIIALVLFVIAAFTDLIDGKLSRKYNIVTTFGKIMDPIADKVLNLGTFFTFYYLGVIPLWIFLLIFAREFLVTAYRLVLLQRGRVIAAEMAGKLKTTAQFVTLFVIYVFMMLERHFSVSDSIYLGTVVFMYIMLLITISLTVYSGILFFVKNKIK